MDIQAEARRKSAELYAMSSKIGTENAKLKAKCEEYRTVLRAVCALVIEIVDKYRLFEPKADESSPKKRRGRPPKEKNLEKINQQPKKE